MLWGASQVKYKYSTKWIRKHVTLFEARALQNQTSEVLAESSGYKTQGIEASFILP